jgi:hypothetical protein
MKTSDPQVLKLLEVGLAVTKASFIQAVDTIHDISEKRLDVNSNVSSRKAEMYYTPIGLLCIQLDEAFLVPLSNIISAK